MKLSEAILKGCEGTYKITEELFEESGRSPTPKGCCALGAAILGIGWEKYAAALNGRYQSPEEFISEYIEGVTPGTPTPTNTPSSVKGNCLFHTIVLLNDYTDMPREDIAKLLAECGY